MCTTCGCGAGEVRIEGQAHDHDHSHPHVHADGTVHSHGHDHVHAGDHGVHQHAHGGLPGDVHQHEHRHADGSVHSHDHAHIGAHEHPHEAGQGGSVFRPVQGHDHLHYGQGPAHAHAPGLSQARMVSIEQNILAKNDGYAARNRQRLADQGILALNLVSSPGSGKTTLLVRTIQELAGGQPLAVIEGDQQTSQDAERIRAAGARAIQINTGKGCHLDAHMVGHALEQLALADDSVLMIENVGNLVCPAAFDLGEAAKVVILSVTEGEDKPIKYPDMFAAAQLMLLNKCDLLPYLNFDVGKAIAMARRVNPSIEVIQVSATSGQGLPEWLAWIEAQAQTARTRRRDTVARLQQRIAELEAQLAAK